MRRLPAPRGFSLPELLVTASVLGLLAMAAVPAFAELQGQMVIRSASATVVTLLQKARMRALHTRCEVGVKWTARDGDVVVSVYQDGNGNGIRSEDIRRGVDTLVEPPFSMRARFGKVTFSFLPGFSALDPSGAPIGNLADPFRLGLSDICSFSPTGTASPGSIYLSDRKGRQQVIRIHPVMARIQVLEYRFGVKRWERLY